MPLRCLEGDLAVAGGRAHRGDPEEGHPGQGQTTAHHHLVADAQGQLRAQDRLRTLEESGIVTKDEAAPPVATAVYRLTPWGEQLWPTIRELTRWAIPLMAAGRGEDEFRGRWLQPAVLSIMEGIDLAGVGPVRIRLVAEDGETDVVALLALGLLEPRATGEHDVVAVLVQVDVLVADGVLRSELHPEAEARPDLVLEADGGDLLGVLTGAVPLGRAEHDGTVWAKGSRSARADLGELARRAFARLGPQLSEALGTLT